MALYEEILGIKSRSSDTLLEELTDIPLEKMSGLGGLVKTATRGYLEPLAYKAARIPVPWLKKVPAAAQIYGGLVSGGTFGNLPNIAEEPKGIAEEISYEAGNLAGMGLGLTTVTAAKLHNPLFLGALYGALQPTGYSVGTKEDSFHRLKNTAGGAAFVGALGWSARKINSRIAGPFIKKAFDANPASQAAAATIITDIVLGGGLPIYGAATAPTEASKLTYEGLLETFGNIFSAKTAREMAIGAVAFPLGASLGEQFLRIRLKNIKNAQQTTVTKLKTTAEGMLRPEYNITGAESGRERFIRLLNKIQEVKAGKEVKSKLEQFESIKGRGLLGGLFPETYEGARLGQLSGFANLIRPITEKKAEVATVKDASIYDFATEAKKKATEVKTPQAEDATKDAEAKQKAIREEAIAAILKHPDLSRIWKAMPESQREGLISQYSSPKGLEIFRNLLFKFPELNDLLKQSKMQDRVDDLLGKDRIDILDLPDNTREVLYKALEDKAIPEKDKKDILASIVKPFPKTEAKQAAAMKAVNKKRDARQKVAKAANVPIVDNAILQDILIRAKKFYDNDPVAQNIKNRVARLIAADKANASLFPALTKAVGLDPKNKYHIQTVRAWFDKEFDAKKLTEINQAANISDQGVEIKTKNPDKLKIAADIAKLMEGEKKTETVKVKPDGTVKTDAEIKKEIAEGKKKAKALLRDGLNKLGKYDPNRLASGLPINEKQMEGLIDIGKGVYTLGKYTAKDFNRWSKEMIRTVGDWAKESWFGEFLKQIWDLIQESKPSDEMVVTKNDPTRRDLADVLAGKSAVIGTDFHASVQKVNLDNKIKEIIENAESGGFLRDGIDPKHLDKNNPMLWVVIKDPGGEGTMDLGRSAFVGPRTVQGLQFDIYATLERAYEDLNKTTGVMAVIKPETWANFIKENPASLELFRGGEDLAEYGGILRSGVLPIDGVYYRPDARKDVVVAWGRKALNEDVVFGRLSELDDMDFIDLGDAHAKMLGDKDGLIALSRAAIKAGEMSLGVSGGSGKASSVPFKAYFLHNIDVMAMEPLNRNLSVLKLLERAILGQLGEIKEANNVALAKNLTNEVFENTQEFAEFTQRHSPESVLKLLINRGLFKRGTTLYSRVRTALDEKYSERMSASFSKSVAKDVFMSYGTGGTTEVLPLEKYKSYIRTRDLLETDPSQLDLQLRIYLRDNANKPRKPLSKNDIDRLKEAGAEELAYLMEFLNLGTEDSRFFQDAILNSYLSEKSVDMRNLMLDIQSFKDSLERFEKTGNIADVVASAWARLRKRQLDIKSTRQAEDKRFEELQNRRIDIERYVSLVRRDQEILENKDLAEAEKTEQRAELAKLIEEIPQPSVEEFQEIETGLKELSAFERMDYRKAVYEIYKDLKSTLKKLSWREFVLRTPTERYEFSIRAYDPTKKIEGGRKEGQYVNIFTYGPPRYKKGGEFEREGTRASLETLYKTKAQAKINEIAAVERSMAQLENMVKVLNGVVKPSIARLDVSALRERAESLSRPPDIMARFDMPSGVVLGYRSDVLEKALLEREAETTASKIESLKEQLKGETDPEKVKELQESLTFFIGRGKRIADLMWKPETKLGVEESDIKRGFELSDEALGKEVEKDLTDSDAANSSAKLYSFSDPITAMLYYFSSKALKGAKKYFNNVWKGQLEQTGNTDWANAYNGTHAEPIARDMAGVMKQQQERKDRKNGYVSGLDDVIYGVRLGEADMLGQRYQNNLLVSSIADEYQNFIKNRLGKDYVPNPKASYIVEDRGVLRNIAGNVIQSFRLAIDYGSGAYTEALKRHQITAEPVQRMFKLALESIYVIDPKTGEWAYTETSKDIDPVSGRSKRQIWDEWLTKSERNFLFRLSAVYRQTALKAISEGVFADVDAFEASYKKWGYEHSIPIDKLTGKPFSGFRAFLSSEQLPKSNVTMQHGKTNKTILEREKEGPEIMDQVLTLKHYLDDFAQVMSYRKMSNYWKTIMMSDGLPLFLHSTDKETPWGMKIDWDKIDRTVRQPLGRDVPALSRYNPKVGQFESALVHPDLVSEFEGLFKYYKQPTNKAVRAYGMAKSIVRSIVLAPIFDNIQMVMGPAYGLLGPMGFAKAIAGGKGRPSVFDYHDYHLPEARMRRARAGVRLSNIEEFSKGLYDEFDLAQYYGDVQKSNAIVSVFRGFKLLALDKARIDQYLYRVFDNFSAVMFDHLSDKIMQTNKLGREHSDRLAASIVNEAMFTPGRYTFSKNTGEAARYFMISRNMAFANIRLLTGATPWGSANSNAPFIKWFTRNYGWRGFSSVEQQIIQQTMARKLMQDVVLIGMGQALISYFLNAMNSDDKRGVWPWERGADYSPFKIYTGMKDSMGKEIVWSSPMAKTYNDNMAFWNMFNIATIAKPGHYSYLINKTDILTKSIMEVVLNTNFRGSYTRELVHPAAPFNERVAAIFTKVLGDVSGNLIKGQIDVLAAEPVEKKDLLTLLWDFWGGSSGTTGVSPGRPGLEEIRIRKMRQEIDYRQEQYDRAIDKAWRAGNIAEYNRLLAGKSLRSRRTDYMKRMMPYKYALRQERTALRRLRRLEQAEQLL